MDNSKVRVVYIKATKEILFRSACDTSAPASGFSEVGILSERGFTSEMNTMNDESENDYFQERVDCFRPDQCIELLEPRAIYEALVELALKKGE